MRYLATLALVWALAAPVSAQDAAVLIVEDETTEAERDTIAAALREELGLDIRSRATAEDGELALTVSVRGRRARLEVTRPERARMVRRVTLPRDPGARRHTLVTLAINLTRDEAAGLLASLRRPVAAAIAGAVPPSEGTAPMAQEPLPVAASVETAVPRPIEAPAPEPADPWRHRVLRLGAGAHLGTAPEVGGGVRPWTIFGVDLVVAPIPELAIGVRDLGVISDGLSPVIVAGPVVEGAIRVHERVALHAIAGADLQLSFSDTGNETFSVAPRLGLGARVYLDPIFSIALDLTGRLVATEVFYTMTATLPSLSVLLSAGVSFAFHIE